MVTVDDNGHVFIWKYDRGYTDAEGVFEPAYKYRISLNYQKFERIASKVLPPNNQGEGDARQVYKRALDLRHCASSSGHYKYVLPGQKRPANGRMFFREVTFNFRKEYMKTEQGAYVYADDRA